MLLLTTAAAMALSPIPGDVAKHPFGGRVPVVENVNSAIQSGWDVQHYEIHADFNLISKKVETSVEITVRATTSAPGRFTLHANGPTVSAIEVEGTTVEASVSGQQLLVPMPEVSVGTDLTVVVDSSASLGWRRLGDPLGRRNAL